MAAGACGSRSLPSSEEPLAIVVGTTLRDAPLVLRAGLLARALGTSLRVVHVSRDPRAAVVLGTGEEPLLAAERGALDALADRVREQAGIAVVPALVAGQVADSLVFAAESDVAQVLVLGDRTGPGDGGLLGSVVEQVVRRASVPVLVLRQPHLLDAWLQGEAPLRVLAASDGGYAAIRTLRVVHALGEAGPLDLEVVSVVSPDEESSRLASASLPGGASLVGRAAEARRRALRALSRQAGHGPEVTVRVVESQAPAEAVLADEHAATRAALIACAVRKTSWLAERWQGSVANGLLRRVRGNVLAVPRLLLDVQPAAHGPLLRVVSATIGEPADGATLARVYGFVADGGQLHVVQVLPGPPEPPPAAGARAVAAGMQRRLPPGHDARGVSTEVHVLHSDDPAAAIADFAARLDASAICLPLGSAGPLATASLLVTAQALLGAADRPVVLVPPPAD